MIKIIKSVKNVKIISGYTGFGGSTILFIELCRILNNKDVSCTLYGPNDWHLGEASFCKSLNELLISSNDIVIGHLPYNIPKIFHNLTNCILYTHEKSGTILVPSKLHAFSKIVFACESQKEWHGYYKGKQEQYIIPAPTTKLQKIANIKKGMAGVIGQPSLRKLTHVSILRALKDGYKVLIFGPQTGTAAEEAYFRDCVAPLIDHDRVVYMGESHNKQEMYEMISCVYHSATEEVACLVQEECKAVGIPFYGNCNVLPYETWSDDAILQAWMKLL